jgi:hypothetical protein
LQLSRLWSSTWSKIRSAKWGNLLQNVSMVQSEIWLKRWTKIEKQNCRLLQKIVIARQFLWCNVFFPGVNKIWLES